jgi:hypothetical protein
MIGPPIATTPETDAALLAATFDNTLHEVAHAVADDLAAQVPRTSDTLRTLLYQSEVHHGLWLACGQRIYVPDATFREACEAREWILPDMSVVRDGEQTVGALAFRLDPQIPFASGGACTGGYIVSIPSGITFLPVTRDAGCSVPIPNYPGKMNWGQSSDRFCDREDMPEDQREHNRIIWRIVVGLLVCLESQAVIERPMSGTKRRLSPEWRGLHGARVVVLKYDLARWQTVVNRYRPAPREPGGGTHATPVEHFVRAHTALYWVRDPGGLDVEAFGVSEAMNPLFGVRLERKGHRRGNGEGGPVMVKLVEVDSPERVG